LRKKEYIAEEVIIALSMLGFVLFEFGLKKFINVFYVYFAFALVSLFFIIKIFENINKLKHIKKWEES